MLICAVFATVHLSYKTSENGIVLLFSNIEAMASPDEVVIGTCPNGGQLSRGEAENKQWEEEYFTDSEGKVYVHGQTLDFGVENKKRNVSTYCYSVECPGRKGSCMLCNVWCKPKK